jgi:TonB family protein
MSESTSESTALPPAKESWLTEPPLPPDRWTNRQFVLLLLLALALHLALVFLFGTKKQILPAPMDPAPHLQLTDRANVLVALTDPTLFARPNAHDTVTAFWRQAPMIPPPNFDQPALPQYLEPRAMEFGSLFHEFVSNQSPGGLPLDFKPEPSAVVPDSPSDNPVSSASTMSISEELAQRRLQDTVTLPLWPRNDVLGSSTVQVLVDTSGSVASAVVLATSGDSEADQEALQLAGNLRFATAKQPTIGSITFYWRTVPITSAHIP